MKKVLKSVSICLLIAAMLTGGALAAAPAEPDRPQASAYIAQTSTAAGALGGGKVRFSFDIAATGSMKDVGALQVDIYEVGVSGAVKTCYYKSSAYDYIMGHNTSAHTAGVTYYGEKGHQYYASVRFFAGEHGVKGDIYVMGTAVVTAVQPDGFIPDLSEGDPYGAVIYMWYRAGITSGYEDHSYLGERTITRAETCVILCHLSNLTERVTMG